MRYIHVTHRAIFRQPKRGPLNPSGYKWKAEQCIEIYPTSIKCDEFRARHLAGGGLNELGKTRTLDQMKKEIEFQYEEQLQPWQPWGSPHGEKTLRELDAEYELRYNQDGTVHHLEPNDYTHHLGAAAEVPTGADQDSSYPAACGAKVRLRKFCNAGDEPTCRKCQQSPEENRQ